MDDLPTCDTAHSMNVAQYVRPGDQVFVGHTSGEPTRLLKALLAERGGMADVSLFIGMMITDTLSPDAISPLRLVGLGGAGTNQRLSRKGLIDVLPCHYSMLPALIADRTIRSDVALVQAARGARGQHRGQYSLGVSADFMLDAVRAARSALAEVNDCMPFTFGDSEVSAEHIDATVETSRALPQYPPAPVGDTERAIAEHVVRFVPDAATLQIGIGAVPDAVVASLSGKRHLGIHVGLLGDRIVDLIESGAVTNLHKERDDGLTVSAGLLGTDRTYRWAHLNPKLRIRSASYTHNADVLGTFGKLLTINSAIEVDLTGQVNTETAGGVHVGLVGGQVDFVRAGTVSAEGRSIIALPATAKGGSISRIVPRLKTGVVTTARSDVDVMITEYGVAELCGRSLRERAGALIAIAHPDYRRRLAQAADHLV